MGHAPPIPPNSITKPPSAELRPGQVDPDSLPPYEVLDAILELYVSGAQGRDQLVAAGFDEAVVDKVISLVDRAEWKRRQFAPGPKISALAFGRDRRLPITSRWREQALLTAAGRATLGSPRYEQLPQASGEIQAPYGSGPPAASGPAPVRRVRIPHLQAMKERGERWAMLTAYDQYAAEIFDEAGIPVLLVGDSAGNNVYGFETTVPVTVEHLLPLVKAVTSSTRRAMVVADLPFGSYQASPEQALGTATRFMKEGLAHAVGSRVASDGARDRAARQGGDPGHGAHRLHAAERARPRRLQGPGPRRGRRPAGRRRRGAGAGRLLLGRHGDGARTARGPGHRGAVDPHHRHRRRAGVRRAGPGVVRHGRPARREGSALRQEVRRPAGAPSAPRPGRMPRMLPRGRSPPPSTRSRSSRTKVGPASALQLGVQPLRGGRATVRQGLGSVSQSRVPQRRRASRA